MTDWVVQLERVVCISNRVCTLYVGHSALIGTLIAPLMLLGGPLVLRAAAVTGGVVGALSLTAACAPDGKFLTWGGPLAIGLGGVCMACLGKLGGTILPHLFSTYLYVSLF